MAPGVFHQLRGPCRTYERIVTPARVPDLADEAKAGEDGLPPAQSGSDNENEDSVEAIVELRLESDVPVWSPFVNSFLAARILDQSLDSRTVLPKAVIDRRVAHDIGILAFIAVALGYLTSLVSQTNTYIRTDFGLTKGDMGAILAWIRVAGLVAFPVAWFSDRVGRRPVLLWGPPAAIAFTAASGLAQNSFQFAALQVFARGLTIGLAIVVGISAIEVVQAGSRAIVTSILAFAGGPGASAVLIFLFIADRSQSAWRWLYFIPALLLVPLFLTVRKFEETPRHQLLQEQAAPPLTREDRKLLRRRLIVVGAAGFLTNVFAAPYANGFNDHLRVDRGFTGPEIGLFQWATNMPYSIGVALGGGWLERWGRRKVGGAAAFGSAVANSVQFLFGGALFWIVSAFGSLLAGPLLPALGVVGAESFPTAQRGQKNGILTMTSLGGSAVGLVVGGALSDRYGFPKSMVMLAAAPIALSVIVRFWYPDGTGKELEDFNPGESAPTPPAQTTTPPVNPTQ